MATAHDDTIARLPELWDAASSDDDPTAVPALLDALLGLEYWYAVPQLSPKGDPVPAATVIEGVPALLVFSTSDKAVAFAKDQDLGEPQPMRLAPAEVLRQQSEMAESGIQLVMVDLVDTGIFVPFGQLVSRAEQQGELTRD